MSSLQFSPKPSGGVNWNGHHTPSNQKPQSCSRRTHVYLWRLWSKMAPKRAFDAPCHHGACAHPSASLAYTSLSAAYTSSSEISSNPSTRHPAHAAAPDRRRCRRLARHSRRRSCHCHPRLQRDVQQMTDENAPHLLDVRLRLRPAIAVQKLPHLRDNPELKSTIQEWSRVAALLERVHKVHRSAWRPAHMCSTSRTYHHAGSGPTLPAVRPMDRRPRCPASSAVALCARPPLSAGDAAHVPWLADMHAQHAAPLRMRHPGGRALVAPLPRPLRRPAQLRCVPYDAPGGTPSPPQPHQATRLRPPCVQVAISC